MIIICYIYLYIKKQTKTNVGLSRVTIINICPSIIVPNFTTFCHVIQKGEQQAENQYFNLKKSK